MPRPQAYLLDGGPVGHTVRVGDVGDDTLYWYIVERIPPQDGLQADREATSEREGRSVGIPPAGGCNGRGGTTGGGYLRLPLT